MRLWSIELWDFRSYSHAVFEAGGSPTLLLGENAAGKTNLLEAVHVLATGRSHRHARDADLVRDGCEGYALRGLFRGAAGDVEVELSYQGGSAWAARQKRLRLNGVEQARLSAILGRAPVVVFGPEDLDLSKGPPAGRRRYLDLLLAQALPAYAHDLARYQEALAERNHLLAQGAPAELLEAWDEPLIESGSRITARRARACSELDPPAAAWLAAIGAGERLTLVYEASAGAGDDAPTVAESYRRSLRENRGEERRRGMTLLGPHRDDIILSVGGGPSRARASQGQHRSIALALKLAARQYLLQHCGEEPLLLLDDVFSELDEERSRRLVAALGDGQTVITATSPPPGLPPEIISCRVERGAIHCG